MYFFFFWEMILKPNFWHKYNTPIYFVHHLLAAFLAICRNGNGVVYRHRCCMTFVPMSFFDLCGNFCRNLLLILFRAFKSIILLLEQVHQIRHDFVHFWRWSDRKERWRQRKILRVRRRWMKECYIHCCGRTSVDRSVRITLLSFPLGFTGSRIRTVRSWRIWIAGHDSRVVEERLAVALLRVSAITSEKGAITVNHCGGGTCNSKWLRRTSA